MICSSGILGMHVHAYAQSVVWCMPCCSYCRLIHELVLVCVFSVFSGLHVMTIAVAFDRKYSHSDPFLKLLFHGDIERQALLPTKHIDPRVGVGERSCQ